jgi:4'-phosphopantetheinyl transferase
MLDLPAGQVDLWFTRTDRVDLSLAARYHALLTPHELAQHARFHFEKDRHRHLVTRALVREVLSRYAPVAPHEWRFEAGRYGKPYIVGPANLAKRIAFNISHTGGLVIVGVSRTRALGVDAECMQRRAALEIAERFFSPLEARSLRRLSPQAQALRFWELWTLKESYIKARGMGLSIPLDQFALHLDEPRTVSIEFAPGFDDVPSRWQFWQMRPTAHHLLALCVESLAEDEAPIRLSVREATPLRSHRVVHCPVDRYPDEAAIDIPTSGSFELNSHPRRAA